MTPRIGRGALPVLIVSSIALFIAACGGGGDEDADPTGQPDRTVTATASSQANVTPGASPERGTPSSLTPGASGETATPGGAAPPAPGATTSSVDATQLAEAGGDIAGGDPSAPRAAVGDVPDPPSGATIDPTAVTEPQPSVSGLQLIVDANASEPGIQSSRQVNEGDVFRIAVVAATSPGIASFNFFVDYDKNVAIAPSYAGGSPTDRNPDLDEASMGAGWMCLPAPEGDIDDPGGIEGDGNADTGRALLSCFNTAGNATGNIVLATIEFHAVATGQLSLALSAVALGNPVGTEVGRCESDPTTGPVIPCVGATVSVN